MSNYLDEVRDSALVGFTLTVLIIIGLVNVGSLIYKWKAVDPHHEQDDQPDSKDK